MKEPIRKLDRRPDIRPNLRAELRPDARPNTHSDSRPDPALLRPALLRPVRLVVAALILRQEQGTSEILICQRKPDQPMSLKWEFPGGKVEDGETSEQALSRELNEELGIHATIGRRVCGLRHRYRNGGTIDLQFFLVSEFTGPLQNRIFNDVRWSPLTSLPDYDFLAADLGLIRDLSEGKLL